MSIFNSLLSPISVAFLVMIAGYYIGKINIYGISLNLSGVLVFAVFIGWLLINVKSIQSHIDIEEYQGNMKFFSMVGTALFIPSIGISTGNTLTFQSRKDLKATLIGSLMVFSAFLMMKIIPIFDSNTSLSKLLGSLCGALTTTPGLSTACELENVVPQEATLGYGCTYVFGVVATVLFVQITTRKAEPGCEEKKKLDSVSENKVALSGLIYIGISVFTGRFIGTINILGFSLGNSGGMLCASIIVGITLKILFPNRTVAIKSLEHYRNLGLVMFFVGNGIPAGIQLGIGFDIILVFYGIIMTTIPIFVGMLLYKLFFREALSATVVAGGMTSTPAIGVLIEKNSNIVLSRYSLAYVGALVSIVLLIRLLI